MGHCTAALAGWYGFTINDDGAVEDDIIAGEEFSAVRLQQLDNRADGPKIAEEMIVADVLDLLDGFYDQNKVVPLFPPTCVITKWGLEWLRRTLFGDVRTEQVATDALRALDVEANDPMDYVETHTHTFSKDIVVQGQTVRSEVVVKEKKVIKKGKRSNFAACVAHLAYNKFGARPMTEANVLVTRRWLSKMLSDPEYKDLRIVDRNIAIDRALFLSFVPTDEFRTMKLAVATRAWQKRVDPKGLLGGIFGKAFMIIRDNVPDGLELQ
jgi:hypothetical protein